MKPWIVALTMFPNDIVHQCVVLYLCDTEEEADAVFKEHSQLSIGIVRKCKVLAETVNQ